MTMHLPIVGDVGNSNNLQVGKQEGRGLDGDVLSNGKDNMGNKPIYGTQSSAIDTDDDAIGVNISKMCSKVYNFARNRVYIG